MDPVSHVDPFEADFREVITPQFDDYTKMPKLTNKNIFRVRNQDLTHFFKKKNMKQPDNQGECRISLNILRDCGYNHGLCRLLNTNPQTGIIGDRKDLERRVALFGKHSIQLPTIENFSTLLARQFEDNNVIFLIWAATAYLGISVFGHTKGGYIQSLTIYGGLIFAAVISAICDYIKESQFLKLKDEINNQTVVVYRGAHGTCHSIPIRELVVGDVVDVQQGDRVPADCILIEEMNIKVDQSMYFPGEVSVEKEQSNFEQGPEGNWEDNHRDHPDPFLLSDSKIMTGQGKAIVCAVGKNTLLASNRKPKDLQVQEQYTYLEDKLDQTAKQIGKYAIFATLISIFTQIIFTLIRIMVTDQDFLENKTLKDAANIGITAVVLMMVAIPEGLPLAISIAMALSINKLKNDNILIKNVESIQTCAMLHDVCCGKTGTVTTGEMHVAKFQMVDNHHVIENDRLTFANKFSKHDEISNDLRQIIIESIISNTDVRIETNDEECIYEPKGMPLEVGMIQFLIDNEEDIQRQLVDRNKYAPVKISLPFDQSLKRKVVVRHCVDNAEYVRVYVKGAPEYVIGLCSQTLTSNAQKKEGGLSENDQYALLQDVVSNQMAQSGLKVLTYAFKEILLEDLDNLIHSVNTESEEFRMELEADLVYLGTFGLDDPLRPEIEQSIQYLKFGHLDPDAHEQAQVNIRMISGDHIDTCKAVAKKAGIIKEDEMRLDEIAMTGDQFREAIGQYDANIWDPINQEFKVEFHDRKRFDEVKKRLKIIARATVEDKFILISGIKQKGGLIGMTGDSIADADALRKADVGLCMGSGCDVAKDNSDLVILDNNFISIYKSVQWGRTIFENVRKFIQFQLTINIVICFITILGGATIGHKPLNVIQMLWTNLIMDILGAIAIGTEPFQQSYTRSKRISRRDQILTPWMWRQILGQSLYQIIVMVFLMYFGNLIFFTESFNLVTEDALSEKRLTLDTICFHTFILMNLFNSINCRLVDSKEVTELNIFKTICNNPTFWIIFAIEVTIQDLMVRSGEYGLGKAFFGTAKLTDGMSMTCWTLGAFSLIVNLAIKQIPIDYFAFTGKINLETEQEDQFINKYMKMGQDQYKKTINQVQQASEQS